MAHIALPVRYTLWVLAVFAVLAALFWRTRQLRRFVPVVSFGVKGGREAAAAFMGHLKIAAIETHVADARTCCLHPASSTHRQMNDEQLIAAGVQPDLVRMSCGLEDKNDLIHDIAQALDQI